MSGKKEIYLVNVKVYIEGDGKLNKETGRRADGVTNSFECVMIAEQGESKNTILKRNKARFLEMASRKYSGKVLTKALEEKKLKVSELNLVKKIGRTVYELD